VSTCATRVVSWVAFLSLASCGEGAKCTQRSLVDVCSSAASGCPATMGEAMRTICDTYNAPSGDKVWMSAQNGCGGVTLSSPANLSGVTYYFGASGELVGIGGWTDVVPADGCVQPSGRACGSQSPLQEHSCSPAANADAGSR
jgi:hypothetical protein